MKLLSILNQVLDGLGGIFNQKNMDSFNKAMSDFGKSMDSVTKELSNDVSKSNENTKKREAINKKNLDKIYGNSKHTKIWSDKKSKESLF